MKTRKIDDFLKEIKRFQQINEYFSQFQIQELFSDDCDTLHQIFEKLYKFPKCLLDYNANFNSSFIAMYINVAIPTEVTDLFLMDVSHILDKLTIRDLNFIVPVIASKLTEVQKAIVLFNFPDCAATFVLLTTLFQNEHYFILTFQRIYSSYHLIPQICRPIINSSLRLSIYKGPAKYQFLGMFPIIIRSYIKNDEKGEISPFEIVLDAIIDSHPNSTEHLKKDEIESIVSMILKLEKLPHQTLIFFELIKAYPILTYQQVYHFICQSPEILFNYIKKLPLEYSEEVFASIMINLSSIPMIFPNQDYILTVYKHFLLFSLHDDSHIRFIFQSNIKWLFETLKKIKGDQLDTALLGIHLLLFRCFDSYSNIILEYENFYDLICESLNRIKDKFLFIDIFLYSIDPENRKCPFEQLIQLEILKEMNFPPPSPSFIYRIVPLFFDALIKISISTEKVVDPILKYLMKKITPLLNNSKMTKFLASISSSENICKLFELAENDEETFRFLSLSLGYSCNFNAFSSFFTRISQDFDKTLKFLSFVVESSNLVTDFLYISHEFSMPLSPSSSSIAVWVRPVSGISPLFQISTNKVIISMRISPTTFYPSETQEIQLPESIDGWYFVTLSFFQFNTLLISVNLTTVKAVYPNPIFPCTNFVIGGKNSNFELQSVRVFKNVLTDDDFYQLFSLGPNFNETLIRNFTSFSIQKTSSFVTENGFISHFYLPFIHKLSKRTKYDNNSLNCLEYSLLPPFTSLYQNSKPFLKFDAIGLNLPEYRCCTFSFLNSLQCHGGFYLIIHFIAEVILKHPSLNNLLFEKILLKLFDYFPVFNSFFEKNNVYALVGHLLWSGNTLANETINLAMKKCGDDYYLTNPGILENWIFDGQLYFSEIPDVIEKMMNSLMIPWNFNILVNVKFFDKIVNLLCGTSVHSDRFLNILYMLAVKLTSLEKVESNAKLVFERLILCHFSFSLKSQHKKNHNNQQNDNNQNTQQNNNNQNTQQNDNDQKTQDNNNNQENQENKGNQGNENNKKNDLHFNNLKSSRISFNHEEIDPINTVYLIRILNLLLSQYPNVQIDLELFIPAIVTSVPCIKAEIIKILILHLDQKYLHFLSFVLKQLPYIKEIADSIYSLLDESVIPLTFVQMTTCLTYLVSYVEFKDLVIKLCSHAGINTSLTTGNNTLSLSEVGSFGSLSSLPTNLADESNIAFNQAIECIAITEKSGELPHVDDHSEISDFMTYLICSGFLSGQYELVSLFFCSIYTIPNVPTYRCAMIVLFFMNNIFKLISNYYQKISNTNSDFNSDNQEQNSIISKTNSSYIIFSGFNLDKIIEISTNYVAFLVHKIRLTPGSINEQIINLLENYSCSLIEAVKMANSNDSTSNLIYFLISMLHIQLPSSFVDKISTMINDVPKIQKQKRYQELLDRIEQPENMIPSSFQNPFLTSFKQIEKKWQTYSDDDRIGLFSLSCRSIHQQVYIMNTFQMNDSDVIDDVIELWIKIFRSLQFPDSCIYPNFPKKWMISDYSMNYKQRKILYPINPSIDRLYESFWKIKYPDEKMPKVRLKLSEVLQYTPISLYNPNDVKFSSSAHHLSGITNYVGVFILTVNKIKFYRRSKSTSSSDELGLDFITIKLNQIHTIKLKKFHHQPTGIEILCENNPSYIFSFDNSSICDLFIETISQFSMYNITIIKSINMKEIQNMMQKWIEGTVSNFDYLLFLNEQSGRSWNDLTQYPIFPWIIRDYSSKHIDLDDPSFYRDLSLPIFAQTKEQQEQCMKYYMTTSSLSNDDGHCMPNYFSNVGCTLYYLVRLEPFIDEEISFQGGSFDAADRTFQSFDISYSIMVSYGNKGSLELIPDFFFNPETLKNINNARFPDSILCKRVVNDVILPPWASSHRELVKIMRQSLESPITSQHLHEWIDLVWGFRRRGQTALEKFNVFQKSVFEFNIEEVIDNRTLFKAMRDQIHNCGQAADELFKSPHPKRNFFNEPHNFEGNLKYQPIKKSSIQKKDLKFAFNNEGWIKVDTKLLSDSDAGKSSFSSFRINNGNLECINSQNGRQILTFCDEIKATSIDVIGNLILTGHKIPIVNIWSLKSDKAPFILFSLNCHLSAVSAVSFFGNDWPMFAVGHEDGFVSLFSMNPPRFLRSISLGFKLKVSLIRISDLSGEILVVQNQFVTLWTLNGELVNSVQINDNVIDAVFTNFTDGLRSNFIFLLCEKGNILTLNAYDMNIINYQTNNNEKEIKEKPISLCFKIDSLYVQHADSSVTCWKLL